MSDKALTAAKLRALLDQQLQGFDEGAGQIEAKVPGFARPYLAGLTEFVPKVRRLLVAVFDELVSQRAEIERLRDRLGVE